jgi:hypothetical protein
MVDFLANRLEFGHVNVAAGLWSGGRFMIASWLFGFVERERARKRIGSV